MRGTRIHLNRTSIDDMEPKVSPEDRKAKDEAHTVLDRFHNLCGLYNMNALDDTEEWGPLLKTFQSEAKEAKRVIAKLLDAEKCEATEVYMDSVARLLIRFSYLIHYGRKETFLEQYEHVQKVRSKYGY